MNLADFLKCYNGYVAILENVFDNYSLCYCNLWDNDNPKCIARLSEFADYTVTEFVVTCTGNGINVYVEEI